MLGCELTKDIMTIANTVVTVAHAAYCSARNISIADWFDLPLAPIAIAFPAPDATLVLPGLHPRCAATWGTLA
jgi:hypothetical protein